MNDSFSRLAIADRVDQLSDYGVVFSGNYTVEPRPTGMDTLTKRTVTVDVILEAALIALEAFAVIRWKKKNG